LKSPEILSWLVRRLGLLILLTLIGGTAGAVYGAVKTPTYTAKAYVVAIGEPGESITALNFAQAYGRIATSGPILAKAGAALGTDQSGLSQVTASTSPDAPVIEVTAAGSSAQHTADLANAVAGALAQYGGTRKTETRVNLALLAGATTPARPSSPKPPLELAVGAAGGLLIGGLAVLAGVGRWQAVRDKVLSVPDQPATEYEAAEVEQEPARPAEIERYLDGWRAKHPPKAITSYRAAPAPAYEPADGEQENEEKSDAAPVDPSIPGQRIVGRAVVSGTEDQ
jgi:capsular polysaccharide biosynthesis protein